MGIFGYENDMLGDWSKFPKWQIYFFSIGAKDEGYFHSTRNSFRDTELFSNCHVLGLIPEFAHILHLFCKGLKRSLFLLYGQRFVRYRQEAYNRYR